MDELAALIGCKPTSYACMKRWLTKNDWPHAVSMKGIPKVTYQYHAARLSGVSLVPKEFEPNFAALEVLSPHQIKLLARKKEKQDLQERLARKRAGGPSRS